MNKGLLDNIEEYFIFQKELFGDYIYITDEQIPQEDVLILDDNLIEDTKFEVGEEEVNIKKNVNVSAESAKKDVVINPVVNDFFTEIPEWQEAKSIEELNKLICNCKNCELGYSRTNFVFGTGNPNADIMVIGEAPGADEDAQGEPFVGRAGQLLTKILNAINFQREDVFICNILKCRPPNNRKPEPNEVDLCEPYLIKQIELIKPAFILVLGLTAIETLLKKKFKMGEIRGSVMNYHNIKMLVTYHPAALLRNPAWKADVWEDVKLLRKLYDEYKESIKE